MQMLRDHLKHTLSDDFKYIGESPIEQKEIGEVVERSVFIDTEDNDPSQIEPQNNQPENDEKAT